MYLKNNHTLKSNFFKNLGAAGTFIKKALNVSGLETEVRSNLFMTCGITI